MATDPLSEAYNSTPIDGEGFARQADLQLLEAFQATVTIAKSWELEGRIKIIQLHEENQTGNRLVDFIHFRRLK